MNTRKEDKDKSVDPSLLEKLTSMGATDLTPRAQAGQLAHAYGREAVVSKVFEGLTAGRSVMLLGPANVGKTAILHEAITRIARKQAPEALHGTHVVAISTGAVMVGTRYLGEWQTRLGELLDAVKEARHVLLYVEDIWALRDAGRASDKTDGFSTFIRPYLERQDIVLLGESTPENFNSGTFGMRALSDDQSLMKLINVVTVEPTGTDDTKSILAAVSRDLQRAYRVRIESGAIERAIELTRRFLPYQAFPGKATYLLEEAAQFHAKSARPQASAQQAATDTLVTPDVVSASFSRVTGLPEKIISDTIPLSQEEISAYFADHIVGQDDAVSAVVDVVTLVKAELNDPGRPLGVLFFVGPTGVGKTELAKTLAEYLFGSKDKLIRLDMSEYKSYSGVPDLLHQLTEKQRRQSFSVLLLDEIEKASTAVFDLFLQVFDDARLTDAAGRSVDLHNTIIIMTSNIGTQLGENRGIGFLDTADRAAERRQAVVRAVEEYFRPEFINRLDKIVVFQPLGIAEMRKIAKRELGRALLREGVLRRNILLDFRDEVLDVLLQAGFSQAFGARPLQRAIKEHVLLPLARKIAAQPSAGEEMLELYVNEGRIDAAIIPVSASAEPEPVEEKRDVIHERLTVADAASGRSRSMDLRQIHEAIEARREAIDAAINGERYQTLQDQAQRLLEETNRPSFWDDQERSRQVLSAIYHIERVTDRFADLRSRAERLTEVATMIRRHGDVAGVPRLAASFEDLERDVTLAELELLAGEKDAIAPDAVFLRITPVSAPKARNAGDWPETLAAMYVSWARRKGYEVEAIHESGADPVLAVRGPNLTSILRGEEGVHKLQSEAAATRERSRASVQVRLAHVEILSAPRKDQFPFTREDVQLAPPSESRHREGKEHQPQSVEVNDLVRGLRVKVRCANAEQTALALLAAALLRHDAGLAPADDLARIYHLARTQYVRDPRTGLRLGRARDVLAGAIDDFLLAYLKWQADENTLAGVESGASHGQRTDA
jgi:ATP-dependent Clp protease ATP-binding subunit ClpA